MLASLIAGTVLGLSAGLSPGPLMSFLISQTLKHGVKEGVKVAFAPFITDVPIILIATFVLTRLASFRAVLGLISLLGGLFVSYLAYESFRTSRLDTSLQDAVPQSLSKGAIVNALNPHPYLFWLSVGAPMIIKAWAASPLTAAAFVTGFYVCLTGAKIGLAVLVGKSRQLLMGRAYGYLMRVLGVLLAIFAFLLFRDGLGLLGLLR
jgi:threonine/homoserine/homoserine lactone efflux protein